MSQVDQFLIDHLKLWKDEGVPAPVNELQSIQAWLRYLGENGAEKTKDAMRKRLVILMNAANELYAEGPESALNAGIYENRPDLIPENNTEKKSDES